MPAPTVAAVLAFIIVCIASDVSTRRIPNVISGAAMLTGVLLNTFYFGAAGLLASIAGFLVLVAVMLFPFQLGGVGGGDVKMMGAVGALLGPGLALTGLGVGMVFGGVIMLGHLALRGRLREKLGRLRAMITAAALTRSLQPLQVQADTPGAVALPYSVPLGLGTLAAIAIARVVGVSQ